jgi:hypothetical protein
MLWLKFYRFFGLNIGGPLMKTLERELIRDWQRLQGERVPAIKAALR